MVEKTIGILVAIVALGVLTLVLLNPLTPNILGSFFGLFAKGLKAAS